MIVSNHWSLFYGFSQTFREVSKNDNSRPEVNPFASSVANENIQYRQTQAATGSLPSALPQRNARSDQIRSILAGVFGVNMIADPNPLSLALRIPPVQSVLPASVPFQAEMGSNQFFGLGAPMLGNINILRECDQTTS